MADLTLHIVVLFIIFGTLALLHGLNTYGLYNLYVNKWHVFVRKRDFWLIAMISLAITAICFLSVLPLFLASGFDAEKLTADISDDLAPPSNVPRTVVLIARHVDILGLNAMIFASVLRLWLMYFDSKHSSIVSRNDWLLVILSSYQCTDYLRNNFFTKNKSTFGNRYWMTTKILLPTMICVVALDSSLMFLLPSVYIAWGILRIAIVAIYASVIMYNIPRINDKLFILDESKVVTRTVAVVIVVLMTSIFIVWAVKKTTWALLYPAWFVSLFAFALLPSAQILYPLSLLLVEQREAASGSRRSFSESLEVFPLIAWVLDKCEWVYTSFLEFHNDKIERLHSHLSMEKADIAPVDARVRASKDGVKGVLSFSGSINLFTEHLVLEYSTENMLAIIDLIKFKAKFDMDVEEEMQSSSHFQCIAHKMPLTDATTKDIFGAAQMLCERYIFEGSEYQVNIAGSTRTRMIKLIESTDFVEKKMSEYDLAKMFDQSIKELLNVMTDSFYRWKRTEAFEKYVSFHAKEVEKAKKEASKAFEQVASAKPKDELMQALLQEEEE